MKEDLALFDAGFFKYSSDIAAAIGSSFLQLLPSSCFVSCAKTDTTTLLYRSTNQTIARRSVRGNRRWSVLVAYSIIGMDVD